MELLLARSNAHLRDLLASGAAALLGDLHTQQDEVRRERATKSPACHGTETPAAASSLALLAAYLLGRLLGGGLLCLGSHLQAGGGGQRRSGAGPPTINSQRPRCGLLLTLSCCLGETGTEETQKGGRAGLEWEKKGPKCYAGPAGKGVEFQGFRRGHHLVHRLAIRHQAAPRKASDGVPLQACWAHIAPSLAACVSFSL